MNLKIKKSVLALSMLTSSLSYADDIDIISSPVDPRINMMFIMDMSVSMYRDVPNTGGTSRIEVLRDAYQATVNGFIDDGNGGNKFDNFNFGLSLFGGFDGTLQDNNLGLSWRRFGVTYTSNEYRDATRNSVSLGNIINYSGDPNEGWRCTWRADYPWGGVNGRAFWCPEDLLSNIVYPLSPLSGASALADLSNANYTHPGVGAETSYMTETGGMNTREYLIDFSDVWSREGYVWTPTVDAYYESVLYYRGEQVNAGNHTADSVYSSHPSTYTGTVGDVDNPPVYTSPIDECATNNIVLLTDGQPTHNSISNNIQTMINDDPNVDDDVNCSADFFANNDTRTHGRCAVELARYLATEDQSDSIPDDQTIKTYTIGFGITADQPLAWLYDIAVAGGTEIGNEGDPNYEQGFHNVTSGEELAKAFEDIVNDASDDLPEVSRSFSSPSVSIDTSTLLTNTDTIYVPVFDQTDGLWVGNLKKFKIQNGGLVDADGNSAIDPTTGTLLVTAKDEWATGDVDSLGTGGAASNIPNNRNLYTNDGDARDDLDKNIPAAKFGIVGISGLIDPDDNEARDSLIDFIGGESPLDGSKRNYMGSIIHSEPLEIEYSSGEKRVFVGTNEGFLHAIDDATGAEVYAFMPEELLPNITEQYLVDANITPSDDYIYGVDGSITLWVDDEDSGLDSGDGRIEAGEEDAYLFFGLRRGGGSYTALNISDPSVPDVAWSRTFGTGNSWSEPVVDYLRWGGATEARPVLIVGGGYNDDASGAETAGGNDVYVIDALSGDIVWQASNAFSTTVTNFTGTELPNGIPAKVRAIDVDKDGSIDRLYFGDTGGNIWRADLNAASLDENASTTPFDIDEATLHRVAALGGTGINDRKFFGSPDIAIFENNGVFTTAIAIGSGDRPNPLSTEVSDNFYLLFDNAVSRLPTEDDDFLITMAADGGLQELDLDGGDQAAENYRGWYKALAGNEKVVTTATIFQGFVIFNSFGIGGVDPNVCNPSIETTGTLFVLDLLAGIEANDPQPVDLGGGITVDPAIVLTSVDKTIEAKISDGTNNLIEFPDPVDPEKVPDDVQTSGQAFTPTERVYWINPQ